MSAGPEFFETGMGRTFHESHVPRLLTALERIAAALERLADQQRTAQGEEGPR